MAYKTDPGFLDLYQDVSVAAELYFRPENWQNYTFPESFFDDVQKQYFVENSDYAIIIAIAIVTTALRYIFEYAICKPFVKYVNIDNIKEREKFPESAWKCIVYTFMWGYCAYLLIFSGRYDIWTNPWRVWNDWSLGMPVETDIAFIYFLECGFYLHSVYASLFMDQWRKDAVVILIHHFLTIALILFSYASRYHKIGMNVLLVHDICDILLEFTKVNVYLKKRNGKFYAIHDLISNLSFVLFTVTWFVFRLYWYPLKVLYAAGVINFYELFLARGGKLLIFFNFLLWTLLVLNIYWFYYILLLLYKIATGQSKELNDTREYYDKSSKKSD